MYIDSDLLADTAKVWVYPSNRKFYPEEIAGLKEKIHDFIENWKVANANFKASFKLVYDRFIVLYAADNIALSSADMDAQVSFILALQAEYQIELLDRMNVCFKQGAYVQYKDIKTFKKMLKSKAVSPKTIVFDNLIQTKEELDQFWEIPITESWYNRFL
ncbi:ABC transporter ATPase [Tenacibaculum sp. SG-28]|uniref:ABC transporter ATPase n=1 Tax=Tenacibaculum sp. SG-28 TaxID=754426 RepID=UPI000CF4600B|nr:ABC transporter ATPase [Tenacibaculum sp. SG-28]PQJ21553.1 ABC transporter ATPase [Tenacibaculum sp. SG-28]